MKDKIIQQKNSSIEFYRFLFTIVICLHHSTMFIGEQSWLKHGYICVEFFFILAGYFLFNSFSKEKTHSTSEHVLKRLRRLWPEYAVAAVLAILSRGVFLGDFNLSKAINELLMVRNTGLFRLGGYNYPTWYIPVMFVCGIFIYGMLTVWNVQYKRIIAPLVILVGYTYIWGLETGIENWQYTSFFSIPMIRGMCGMSIGVLIGAFVESKSFRIINRFSANVIELMSLIFIVIGITTNLVDDMVTIVAFIGLIVVTVKQSGFVSRVLSKTNIWNKLGEYSYSIYLNHAVIIYVLKYVSENIFKIDSIFKFPIMILAIGLYSVVANKIIWKCVDLLKGKDKK